MDERTGCSTLNDLVESDKIQIDEMNFGEKAKSEAENKSIKQQMNKREMDQSETGYSKTIGSINTHDEIYSNLQSSTTAQGEEGESQYLSEMVHSTQSAESEIKCSNFDDCLHQHKPNALKQEKHLIDNVNCKMTSPKDITDNEIDSNVIMNAVKKKQHDLIVAESAKNCCNVVTQHTAESVCHQDAIDAINLAHISVENDETDDTEHFNFSNNLSMWKAIDRSDKLRKSVKGLRPALPNVTKSFTKIDKVVTQQHIPIATHVEKNIINQRDTFNQLSNPKEPVRSEKKFTKIDDAIDLHLDASREKYPQKKFGNQENVTTGINCLLYTSPSPRDKRQSRMPSSA